MDVVAAAQLIFQMVCFDASLLSNCSTHVTEILLCCSAFASFDPTRKFFQLCQTSPKSPRLRQKSLVASFHFHSSISSISSAENIINHLSLKCGLSLPAGCLWPYPLKRVLKDLRWWISHHSSEEKSAGLNKLGSAGPRFYSSRKPMNSNQYGFEQIDPQARVLNYSFK